MCAKKGESIRYLVGECGKLAQRKYKKRHDNGVRYVHWQLCNKGGLEEQRGAVIENDNYKLLWDFTIQCDRIMEARRPGIVFVDKKKKKVK